MNLSFCLRSEILFEPFLLASVISAYGYLPYSLSYQRESLIVHFMSKIATRNIPRPRLNSKAFLEHRAVQAQQDYPSD